jgi:putative colanic acid biosynthesis acetyltransferase WcaF
MSIEPGAVDLSVYENASFVRGRSVTVELAWMVVSFFCFRHSLAIGSWLKVLVLRLFGAKIGRGVVIKPSVQIKFPWKLVVGSHSWLGEGVWIDNLENVTIGSNVCVSQGALIICGNHDYSDVRFGLRSLPIQIEEGAWVGANAVVCPGVRIGSHGVLAVGSVATKSIAPYSVFQGNPATFKTSRRIG